MKYHAGIDASLERSRLCMVDATGKICCKGDAFSEPEALLAWFASFDTELDPIGLEARPSSQWRFLGIPTMPRTHSEIKARTNGEPSIVY